jgi:hypothetical protein
VVALASLLSSFSKSVVSPSSKQGHWASSSLEETSFDDDEEEESPSLPSSSPLTRHFFDVAMDTSSSSLAYLRLLSMKVIGVTAKWNLLSYKCQHSGLYEVTEDHSNVARVTI